ncbi:MAG: chitobiase/beta-hexosaminidase C-terminal domain-containing protein [Promethearchaeota archaeon]
MKKIYRRNNKLVRFLTILLIILPISSCLATLYEPYIQPSKQDRSNLLNSSQIDHPPDITLEYDQTASIMWYPSTAYQYCEILKDGEILFYCQNLGNGVGMVIRPYSLPLGTYTYTCRAYSVSEITDDVIVTVVDNDNPTIKGPTNVRFDEGTTGHIITWIAYDAFPDSFSITRDNVVICNGSWGGESITINVDDITFGEYWYACIVYDESGNSASDSVPVIVYDITAPYVDVEIEGQQGFEDWFLSPITIALTAVDPGRGSGGCSVTITSMPGGPPGPVVYPNGYPLPFYDDGIHEITYYGKDSALNAGPEESLIFKIDKTPPETSIALSGDINLDGSYISPVTVTLTAIDAIPGSGLKSIYYRINCSDPSEYSGPFTVEEEGTNFISYYSTDIAGNTGPVDCAMFRIDNLLTSSGSNEESIDLIIEGNVEVGKIIDTELKSSQRNGNNPDPSAGLKIAGESDIDHPPDITLEYDQTASIIWYPSTAYQYCQILKDGEMLFYGQNLGYGVKMVIHPYSLPLGTYTYTCYAYSGSGITDDVIVTVIDNDNPTIKGPTNVRFDEDTTGHTITWIAYDAFPDSFSITRDGVVICSGSWGGESISINVDDLTFGEYWYVCTVYDESGNSASDSVPVIVYDITAPYVDVEIEGRQGFEDWFLSPITIALTAVDPGRGSGGCSVTITSMPGGPPGPVVYPNGYPLPFYDDGIHEITYYGKDSALNAGPEESLIFKIDKTPPETSIEFGTPHSLVNNQVHLTSTTTIMLIPTEITGGSGVYETYYRIYNESYNSGLQVYTGIFTLTLPNLFDGNYLLEFYSMDIAGNTEAPNLENIVVFTENTPPGTNVEVIDEISGVNVTFSEVTDGGTTLIEKSQEEPDPPVGFEVAGDYYNITTDASYLGVISVAIPYNESKVIGDELNLKILHWDPSTGWTDVTTGVDTINNIVYGEFTELSTFVVLEKVEHEYIMWEIDQLIQAINDPDVCWRKNTNKIAMENKLIELKELVFSNELAEAYDKLLHDIKPKLTGLKTDENEVPWGNGIFKNPWVTCADFQETFCLHCNSILSHLSVLYASLGVSTSNIYESSQIVYLSSFTIGLVGITFVEYLRLKKLNPSFKS